MAKIMLRAVKRTFKPVLVFLILLLSWLWLNSKVDTYVDTDPVILWWTSGFPGTEDIRHCENNIKCNVFSSHKSAETYRVDAYMFYASNINFDQLPLPRNPGKTVWGLYHEESPRNVEELSHGETLTLFNFSSTFSRHSDVPFPLQYLESIDDITDTKYFVPTDIKNTFHDLSPIMYLQSDCETATERDAYVKELMKYIAVDSYGACLNNKEMPSQFTKDYLNRLNDHDFLKFVAKYKFVLAFENGVCDDYITEKFWRAIKVGTVPIYFGSQTIRDWLPNEKSAILLEDYPTPKLMSEYIKKLAVNKTSYEQHLEHKTKHLITNMRLVNEIKTRPYQIDALKAAAKFECFVCSKLHELKLGALKPTVVNKDHYNCPQPISALTLSVNPNNDWVFSWKHAKKRAKTIREKVIGLY